MLHAAHHGVALARAGLTVGEYAHVVALEGVLEHLDAQVFVDLALRAEVSIGLVRVRPVRVVEVERLDDV